MSDRLPVHIQIDAVLKECTESGVFFYVPQRGDPHTGTILLKVSDTKGQCKLLSQMRDMDDNLTWFNVLGADIVADADADSYITQSKNIDPDQWIIEIEDASLQNPFDLG